MRRNEHGCIFGEHGSEFCDWNTELCDKLNTDEPLDRIDICKLCQQHDLLKTISYGTKVLKDGTKIIDESLKSSKYV